jgi:uncharacterized protein YfaS (alpha-2-macroglobulin family)
MAGKAMVAVVSDKLLATKLVDVPKSGTTVSFKANAKWGPGAYVLAELYRPMDNAAKRMPGRAIGVKWIGYDKAPRTLKISATLPEKVRPNRKLTVPLSLTGIPSGEKAYVTVAAVDRGILSLTRYEPPKPEGYYFGQRRLGTEIRDLYGKLIDGMQGMRGTIRSGGGGYLGGQTRPLTQEPVAFYSGIVEVGADGKAEVTFDIPAFDGTLRVMTAAWSKNKLGHDSTDVIIRDPLVVQGTPPKFLITGDTSELHLSIANVEGKAGPYTLNAAAEGVGLPANAAVQNIDLALKERKSLVLPLSATQMGKASVKVTLKGPDNLSIERNYKFTIAPAAPNVSRRTVQTIAPNGTLRLSSDLVSDLIPNTTKVTLSAGADTLLDVPGLLLALDRYPYGCAEQTTSRALPLLYFNEMANSTLLKGDEKVEERIEKAIARLALMQSSNGSFSLWGNSYSGDIWLTTYVTDFLVRAREKGHKVPPRVLDMALDNLKNYVANVSSFKKGGEDLAYALYVLARSDRATIGDLRYYTDEKLSHFSTPLAQAQLGAALAMYGDKERAERAFGSAIALLKTNSYLKLVGFRKDFGSLLRDSAGTLALLTEAKVLPDSTQSLLKDVARRHAALQYTNTQEKAWMLLAAKSLMEKSNTKSLEINGKTENAPIRRTLIARDLSNAIVLKNVSDHPISTSVLVNGDSATPELASSSGFAIERHIYTTAGKEIPFTTVKQNQRFVVVLTVKGNDNKLGQVMVEDRLPAGFEIENPQLVSGSDLKAFPWLKMSQTPQFTAFRDDRFTAAFSQKQIKKGTITYTMAYVMRAVSPGTYTHPGAYVEDMYRPERFARTAPAKVTIAR